MPVFPVVAMQVLDFKYSIITIKLYLMNLNLYLTSEWSQGAKVGFCGGCALKLNDYNLNSRDEVFGKTDTIVISSLLL